jgi:cell wall-associated NlpC family hydrolase
VLVLLGVALGGVGFERPVADAAPREAPAHKIARRRAKAARVQAAIDRMRARIERLVEDYNEVREALARTRVEQARTRRQVLEARRRLRAARRLLGRRLWTIYTGGAPSTLGQLLGADSVHQALVTTKYQEQVVGADRAAVDKVERLRHQVEALAARLAAQAARQERLQARLASKRRQIESRLAAQRRYSQRLGRQIRRVVAQERRRQEILRRRALARRLAAARAAAARARSWPGWPGGGAGAPSGAAARVGLGRLAPGDLVFFATNTGNPGTIHHVGMYIGGGAMVEAPYSGARVRISSIGRRDYIGAVRPTG